MPQREFFASALGKQVTRPHREEREREPRICLFKVMEEERSFSTPVGSDEVI